MAANETSHRSLVWPWVAAGCLVVAAVTPLNYLLLWLCVVLTRPAGGGGQELPFVPAAAAGVGLYLALCGAALLAFRRASANRRRLAVVAALVLYLGLSLAGSAALVALLVATDYPH